MSHLTELTTFVADHLSEALIRQADATRRCAELRKAPLTSEASAEHTINMAQLGVLVDQTYQLRTILTALELL